MRPFDFRNRLIRFAQIYQPISIIVMRFDVEGSISIARPFLSGRVLKVPGVGIDGGHGDVCFRQRIVKLQRFGRCGFLFCNRFLRRQFDKEVSLVISFGSPA
jgi:hypothetical protein